MVSLVIALMLTREKHKLKGDAPMSRTHQTPIKVLVHGYGFAGVAVYMVIATIR